MIKLIKANFFLLLIFSLALILRLYSLDTIPHGFHEDELDAGYMGKYIYTYGKDIYGNTLPLYIDKFGDFRPAGIFYVVGIATYLLGVNEFTTRLFPAIFGAVSVIGIYFLVFQLTKNKTLGLLSGLTLAILPWHIVLSRATSEGIIGLCIFLFGYGLLIKSISSQNKKLFIISAALLLLTYFFYHTFRLLIPLLVLPLIFWGKKNTVSVLTKGLTVVFFLISFLLIVSSSGQGRISQVALHNKPDIPITISRLHQGEGPNNVTRARIFHNKITVLIREAATQYLSYFSPNYLFIQGGLPSRYQIPEQGLLLILFAPFLMVGLVASYQHKWFFIPAYFLLVAPLPAAITFDDIPNVHRSFFLIIPLVIFIAAGVLFLLENTKKIPYIVLPFLLILLFGIEEIYFFHQYFIHSPGHHSFLRNDGVKELTTYIIENQKKHNEIILSGLGNLGVYYLFYTNSYSEFKSGDFSKGHKITKIDNLSFLINSECPTKEIKKDQLKKDILIIDGGNCEPSTNYTLINSILRADHTLAFRIYKN